jgi:hypothetical protein
MLTNNKIPLEKRTDLSNRERRFWRSLIRIDSVNDKDNLVGIVIPGWNVNETLYFDINRIPDDLMREIRTGMTPKYRFHADANIGTEKSEDIYIDLNSYEK